MHVYLEKYVSNPRRMSIGFDGVIQHLRDCLLVATCHAFEKSKTNIVDRI
jgi:hypothetical protein